jgi:hypothetical protein
VPTIIYFFRDQIFYFGFKPKPKSRGSSCHLPYDNEGYQKTLDELESERGMRKEAEISAKNFESKWKLEKSNHLSVFIKYKDIEKELVKLKNERKNSSKQEVRDSLWIRLDNIIQRSLQLYNNKPQFNLTLQRKNGTFACASPGCFVSNVLFVG